MDDSESDSPSTERPETAGDRWDRRFRIDGEPLDALRQIMTAVTPPR